MAVMMFGENSRDRAGTWSGTALSQRSTSDAMKGLGSLGIDRAGAAVTCHTHHVHVKVSRRMIPLKLSHQAIAAPSLKRKRNEEGPREPRASGKRDRKTQ
jgi:hypothetical protein